MKQGSLYAGRVKRAFAKLRQQVDTPEIPEATDPLHQLGIATLAVAYGMPKAIQALRALHTVMAGWNEVRVSRPEEISASMGKDDPERQPYCQNLIDMLEGVYERENTLSLDRLRQMGRREAKQYLDSLPSVDAFGVASVTLWSLNGHGIPVDDSLLAELRKADLVHPEASRAEVQAFLERHVSAADAKEFCLAMSSFRAPVAAKAKTNKKGHGAKKAPGKAAKKSAGKKKKKAAK